MIILALAIGIAGWARLPHGGLPSLSFDGFRYLAGAYSLRDHGTYRDIDETTQRVWPPGTSLLYAIVSRISGRAPEELPGAVGIAAYLITMAATAIALLATVRRGWIASVAFAALACNSFVVSMTNKLWSDPPALACFSVALALLIVAKPSASTIAAATGVIALGISFRYAMIAALVLPLWLAWRMRLRWFLPAIGSCLVVILIVIATRMGGFRAPPLHEDVRALEALSAQLLPAQLGLAGFWILAAAIGTAVLYGDRRAAITGVWIAAYVVFLFVAQAIANPSFQLDLRILILLYPAIVIAIASAADSLLNAGRRQLATVLLAILVIGVIRALHGLVPQPAAERPSCVTREQVIADLKKHHVDAARVASNAQGLVWYALRRPITTAPRAGDMIVMVDPRRVCDGIVETVLPAVQGTRVIALP